MPTLIVSPACANALVAALATRPAATRPVRMSVPNFIPLSLIFDGFSPPETKGSENRANPARRPWDKD
jgi:hypothetical protein